MKKILSLFMAVFTFMCLTVSAFASEPPVSIPSWDSDTYPYAVLTKVDTSYFLKLYSVPLYYQTDSQYGRSLVTLTNGKDGMFKNTNGTWNQSWMGADSKSGVKFGQNDLGQIIWMNFTPEDLDVCDGTSCPATDANYDNVCDDCGAVLTMSLRSTLLEYAVNVHVPNGQSIYDADYWVITDNVEGGYTILMATTPFTYTDGVLTTTGYIFKSSVIQMSNGQNGGRGWTTITAGNTSDFGVPVDASHPIDGFFPIPLWTVVEGVTQGGAMELAEATGGTMTTLTLCGVGLMACLVVFALFGKRWLIFLR